jgi:rhamnosyltransferase subunit B
VSRRIVLATFGSYGDLNPFVGIARGLQARGHRPVIASNEEWRSHVEKAGVEFQPVRPGWNVRLDPNRLTAYLLEHGAFTDFRASFDDLMAAVRNADLLVTLTLVTAGPLVARKTGIPWTSVVLEPLSFFSAYETLQLPEGMTSTTLLKLAARPWAAPVTRLRAELGLPPGRDPFCEEYLFADSVLALFSPVLGPARPDWPRQTVLTGFVSYDGFSDRGPMPDRLTEFLDAGPSPIVFTLSSDAVGAPTDNFYAESVLAARMLGRRAVLLGLTLPEARRTDVLCLSTAPFSQVFPRAVVVVHHGGIGTTGIALRAGRPMLVVPGAITQPDIAARLVRLGVARAVPRGQYSALCAVPELWSLLTHPSYAIRAAAIARQVAGEDGARVACEALE